MTLFLASVNGAEEARIALAQGADIIDLKAAARVLAVSYTHLTLPTNREV